MKVESYAVKASSERNFASTSTTTYTGNSMIVQDISAELQSSKSSRVQHYLVPEEVEDDVKVSEEAMKKLQERWEENNAAKGLRGMEFIGSSGMMSRIPSNVHELKISMLEQMLRALTGKEHNVRSYRRAGGRGNESGQSENAQNQAYSGSMRSGGQGGMRIGGAFNMEGFSSDRGRGGDFIVRTEVMNFETFTHETENVSYQAQGVVQTSDGQSISVDISMNMSRESYSYTNLSLEVPPIDPLIINYGGTAASLTNEKFDFDLTMDGVTEQISFAGEGSGFLALDKNGDGEINDGSELFGPQSGSGFGELRGYDKDGNNWIDENDEIYSKLLIWSRDAEGNDQLFTLKDLDIGAIYLGDVETEFTMNGASGEANGVMRSTSFFLKDSGGAGTISHVDLML